MNAAQRVWSPAQHRRTPPSLASVMFRDTITGRMLRTLCERGTCTQAAFMNLYHLRCDRADKTTARSSFGNNFGRFVRAELTHRGWTWSPAHAVSPLRCILHLRTRFMGPADVSPDGRSYDVSGTPENILSWYHADSLTRADLIRSLTNDQRTKAEQFLERA